MDIEMKECKVKISNGIICFLILISIILFLPSPTWAETEIGGNIISDTIWTKANSPYIVTSTVQVLEGVKLVIEPGVVVKFNSGTGLSIGGELNATGTADEMIKLTSNQTTPAPGDWYGLKFIDSSVDAQYDANNNYINGSIVKFTSIKFGGKQFSGSLYGAAIYCEGANPVISNSIISNNYTSSYGGGFYLRDCNSIIIRNNEITSNESGDQGGAFWILNSSGEIKNNLIRDNTARRGGGFYIAYNSPKIINNSIVTNIGGGFYIRDLYRTIEVTENNIKNNSPYAISEDPAYALSKVDINSTNNWWGTTDATEIGNQIYDYYDDISLGKVIYEPIATQPYKIVDFSASPLFGSYPLAVTFTNNSIGVINSVTWDFGDGEISTEFNPTHTYASPGTYMVSLTVTGTDGTNNETKTDYVTVTIPTFPNISVSPANHDFGSVTVGITSVPVVVTITNTGTADLKISDMILSDTLNYSLNVSGGTVPCGSATPLVLSGGNCTISVTFVPQYTGTKNSSISIDSNDPDTPNMTATLRGSGTPLPVSNILVSPSNHDFGTVAVGSTSVPVVVTIANTGTADLNITGMILSDSLSYSLSVNGGNSPCGDSVLIIPVGDRCTIAITFNPQSTGELTATFTVISNDPDTPTMVLNLKGNSTSSNSDDTAVNDVNNIDSQNGGNSNSSGKSGSGGCFIATAAYGSYLDPHVQVLREFRDDYLLTNSIGIAFVKLYYKTSPSIADLITQHEFLKTTTRLILTPIVYGINFPGSVLLILIGIIVIPVVWRVRYWSKSR